MQIHVQCSCRKINLLCRALIFIIHYMCIRLPFQKVLKNLNYIECALVLEPAVVEELCTERANARANSLGDRSL